MRPLLFALAVVLALPASAQTQFADSAGTYLMIREVSFGGSIGTGVDAAVGRRFQNGADLGLRLGATRLGGGVSRRLAIGAEGGYTARLGLGALARIEADLDVSTQRGSFFVADEGVFRRARPRQAVDGSISAELSRPVPILGSLRVHPTLGVYAAARQTFNSEFPAEVEADLAARGLSTDPFRAQAGIVVGLPISVRVLGQDVTLSSRLRMPLASRLPAGRLDALETGIHINF